jgi:glycosyltransferase involved in cell wall biosynthesis
MNENIIKLIRNKKYENAIIEIESGRGSAVEFLNKLNLYYCLRKISSIKTEGINYAPALSSKTIYLVGKISLESEVRECLIKNFSNFNIIKINSDDVGLTSPNDGRLFVTDDAPSALELYRTAGERLSPSDVILQMPSNNNFEARVNTVDWLIGLGLNCFLLKFPQILQVNGSEGLNFIHPSDIENRAQLPTLLAKKIGMTVEELYKNALIRLSGLDIKFLDPNEIIKNVRKNLGKDKKISKIDTDNWNEGFTSFPKDNCALYLKNKYYSITGVVKPKEKEVLDYFNAKSGHKNFYSEIIKSEFDSFEKYPRAFLSNGQTLIFIDPTCYDEESGISSYLVNMYKFFKMSRLVEQTLFIKNPWPSSEKNNRALFRELIAEKFNPHIEFSNDIVFFDSEAHYPGKNLLSDFKKICVVHCSSILAAKFDGKLPAKMPESLIDIMNNEINNVNSAYKIITPTLYHNAVQQSFYKEQLRDFSEYKTDNLINYIHDEYIEYVPFRDRDYDLVFIGRPQRLKGFDVLLAVAKMAKNLNIAIITNGKNEQTDEIGSFDNVTIYFDAPKDMIYKILSKSKAFIDLSPHHNCSTVLLEAMNAKTPAILRDLPTYHEVIGESDLMDLFLLINEEEIMKPEKLAPKLVKYLNGLSKNTQDEYIEKLFNKFMLERYIENYSYYKNIFSELGFRVKKYNTSSVYEKLLQGKCIINVVHSNALSDHDGMFIDSHDLVVRFNRAVENIVPTRHGSRTDILYSCLNRSPESGNLTEKTYNEWIVPIDCWLAKAYPNLQWTGAFSFSEDHQAGATNDNFLFESFNRNPLKTSEFSLDLYKLIEVNIKSRPNTGVLSIIDLLQYSPKSIYLKGYTFFRGGYDKTYRNQNEDEVMSYMARAGNHNQYRQNLFIRKILLTEAALDYDESLDEILHSM